MEIEENEIIISKFLKTRQKYFKKKSSKSKKKLLYYFCFMSLLCITNGIFFFIFIEKQSKKNNIIKQTIKNEVSNDSKIILKSRKEQNDFCNNQTINSDFENQIRIARVNYENVQFNMYVYKYSDIVSSSIYFSRSWEQKETKNLLNSLSYYSSKKGVKKEDIYILDIGSNVGWYTFILGKYGYNIISFDHQL